jgi:hypothetical protein
MAVQDGFGKSSGSESLVFAYDLKDTVNSYRGEPATNSQNADISSMTQVGFDNWSCYDGSPPYHTWGTNQSKTFVTIPGPFGTSVNAMLYHNFNGGFYGPTDWGAVPNGTITSGRTYTVQGWVKAADSESVGKTVTPYTYYSHSGGAYSAGTSYTLTDQWQLVSHTHTAQYNASGDGVMYFFTQNSGEVKMHLTMTGVFLDESHAVPWIIGGSTRSNTQGLLDLTGNNTINLSNVSFDSNAKMVFDGTNDYVNVPHNDDHSFSGDFTIESIIYPTSNTANCIIQKGSGNDYFQEYWLLQDMRGSNSYISLIMGKNGNSDANYIQTANISVLNTYHHIIATVNGNTATIYVNGEQKTTGTISNRTQSSDDIRIGWRVDGFAATSGKIPLVKLYNRSLSPSEITNNYLKYKRQYGLT